MIAFACSHCDRQLSVPDNQAGKKSECPHCGSAIQVPAEDAVVTVAYVPRTVASAPAGTLPSSSATDVAVFTLPGYEILGELGRGGMGVIYKARQLQPRRLVAIKMILTAEHTGADSLARFHSEAESAARLAHPNIVPIYEVGEHNGRPYLTLEFVEGGNLAQKLSAGPLPFRAAAELLHQLARAVDFAHNRGIIHRDLTPANILLAADGTAKITDFGLAKQREGMVSATPTRPRTQSGAILGTPNYMAPEQASGKSKNIGPAADVYGLGAILYECLMGRPPFQADTALDILMKAATEEPIPPRKLRPDCPRDLETIALKCLEKEPNRRYASAAALAEDLQRYLEDKPIACRPPSRLERLRRTMRRRKELVYLFSGVLATLCVGLLISLLARFVPQQTMREPIEAGLVAENAKTRDQLPPDLDLVPRDAFAFASVRLADLWKRYNFKDLVDALSLQEFTFCLEGILLRQLVTLLVEAGVEPNNVDRLTFVMQSEKDPESYVFLLALRNPYDLDRLLKTLTPLYPLQPSQMVEGKTIYSPVRAEAGDPSFCSFNDRILLIGGFKAIRALLKESARGRVEKRLPVALRLAAGSHTAVLALRRFSQFLDDIDETLSQNRLASLRELEMATLVVDSPPQARPEEPLTGLFLHLALDFPDEARARPGLSETMEFLKHLIPLLESNDAPPELRPLAARLLGSLRAVNWRQEGSVVRLTLQLHWTAQDMQDVRTAVGKLGERAVSQNNLKQIGLAMHNYSNNHQGRLPPAVVYGKDNKPLYSWRVLILPYLEQKNLYDQFHLDEPWDSEHNKKLLAKMPAIYAAPWAANDKSMSGQTYYQVFVGPGAAFEGPQGLRTPFDFPDGTSNTLLAAEAAEAVPWTSPQDLVFQPGKPLPRLGGHLPGGFNVLMADTTLNWIKQTISDKTLRAAITRNDGHVLGPDW